ncbi:hypothetical protein CPB86DRAFT_798718 [Serendipita vermifera]|nr:hypothetical protein CPB86DRAFT_798718 [Serendipita vermifera]
MQERDKLVRNTLYFSDGALITCIVKVLRYTIKLPNVQPIEEDGRLPKVARHQVNPPSRTQKEANCCNAPKEWVNTAEGGTSRHAEVFHIRQCPAFSDPSSPRSFDGWFVGYLAALFRHSIVSLFNSHLIGYEIYVFIGFLTGGHSFVRGFHKQNLKEDCTRTNIKERLTTQTI